MVTIPPTHKTSILLILSIWKLCFLIVLSYKIYCFGKHINKVKLAVKISLRVLLKTLDIYLVLVTQAVLLQSFITISFLFSLWPLIPLRETVSVFMNDLLLSVKGLFTLFQWTHHLQVSRQIQ